MNGLVLVHAAPAALEVEVRAEDDALVARGSIVREHEYSPMTLLERSGDGFRRTEVWPTEEHHGMPVLLAGGEVGILQRWEHAEDRSWWRWSVEFSNHTGRPVAYEPPGQSESR